MRGELYLANAVRLFRRYKELADRALAQVPEKHWFRSLGPESNSLAVIMKHLAGNMRSRWTDFLASDGEKPDRRRDTEFELDSSNDVADLKARWEAGWAAVFDALEPLSADDAERIVKIRGEDHTVMEAVQRQLTHYAYHVGQIVFVARHLAGEDWTSLSIPRGGSVEFNAAMERRRS